MAATGVIDPTLSEPEQRQTRLRLPSPYSLACRYASSASANSPRRRWSSART